jgi:SAM-dependent methyltransferase
MKPATGELAALAAYSGDPWGPTNAYFDHAEPFMDQAWDMLIWPMLKGLDLRVVVDLAAGHGRNGRKLIEHCERLIILDIQPGNVERCQARFAADPRVTCHVNSGFDLRPVPDASVSLVYCFDAMVHFDSDVVRAYLADTRRVLVPGGHGFFHHSNYTGGDDWRTGPHSRGFMSRDLFGHYARKEGLSVLDQRVIDWADARELDCVSLVRRDPE